MRWTGILEVFITTALVSYLITPLIRKIAIRTDYLDHPLRNKVHAHPTPLLGGLAIYLAFMIGLFTATKFACDARLVSILTATTFLMVVGLVDDRMGMMPEIKLLGQFLAAMIVIKSGVRMEFLNNYYLNVIVTYIWLVGITNAFNLLDNMNGLSSGIAAIAAIFFGIVMWSTNQLCIAVVCFAIAGAALGFLKHNFPKANIFMGDTGSLVIGFVLASIGVLGSWKTKFLTTSVAMPIIILAYPIFDTTLVTVMRLIEGRSVFQGGKDHSSHRLALLGLKKTRAVLVIYGICIALGLSALLIPRLPLKNALIVIGALAIGMIFLGIRLALVDTGRYGRIKEKRKGE
jgi:UDP-GlcNAc:undecaprenyl-phosphate/decaprenyl-phosphate GlcNAc-1-phosphate transferase